jgi:NAD(P)-dependent dehydrogenase (short-subunit alcohol dehydrogenase family)
VTDPTAPVTLVTGATGTIGQALVRRFADQGHDVAIHYRRDEDAAQALAAAVRDSGRRAHPVYADLAVADIGAECERLLDESEGALGALHSVVLNASAQHLTPWADMGPDSWDAMYRQSLRHTAVLLQRAGKRLPSGGALVVVGSIEGLRPAEGHAAYAVMKAATHHLVLAAAHELGPRGIRVVGIAPGLVDRPRLAHEWPDGFARWNATAALGRPVTADEVASVTAFCASTAATGLTGVVIPVDAGWSAAPGW